jgi:phytol kinase
MSALAGNTWAAIAATLGAFLTLFAGLQVYSHTTNASPESTRKMFHTGSGVLTLTFPFLFQRTWPVLLLTGVSALLVSSVKFLPALRHRFGHVTDRVDRPTLGEVYFPIAVAVLFWLTRESNPLLYVIPIMMLTFADATGALVGRRYGMTPYVGAAKSLEGSVAFVAVAYFCVHVPLLLWSSVGRTEVLLIAATLASLVMLLEGSAWRGLDNLFIPIGGYLLLRAYLPLDAAALFPRFLVTVGLVVLVIIARHRTTLEDDSLLTGAFLCYVAWSVMGWRWLVGPLAITIGYRWLSPPTADNSRRIHEVPAVLSVWAPAIGWLALSSRSGNVALLFPYTVAFGAHLAMFGTSRLGRQFPAKPLATMFWRAVMISWAIVIVPYVLITGAAISNLVAALGAMGAIAIGSAAFVGAEPDVRNAPQTTRRWLYQAVAAGIASAGAWGVAAAASGWTTR